MHISNIIIYIVYVIILLMPATLYLAYNYTVHSYIQPHYQRNILISFISIAFDRNSTTIITITGFNYWKPGMRYGAFNTIPFSFHK